MKRFRAATSLGKPERGDIRDVHPEELLGRSQVEVWDNAALRANIEGECVLVTGAGGSIGSELCRQIARFRPSVLVGLDNAETALYEIDQEMRERFPLIEYRPEIANIQNPIRMEEILRRHKPRILYHAAAYKHVPLMEAHPFEAVENNVFGTLNLVRAATEASVRTFVLISTDKAVRPVNVMGATKRVSELVCLAASGAGNATRFVAVRFGNVLGSNGSVIPRFKRQIASGGPLTVTHPDMHRYFMTISESVQLIMQAATIGDGGEIFVLDMGQRVRILDFARKLIALSGCRPEDIRIHFIGVRPGEKLSEELHSPAETITRTTHPKIKLVSGPSVSWEILVRPLGRLQQSVEARDYGIVMSVLRQLVPDYLPANVPDERTPKARRAMA